MTMLVIAEPEAYIFVVVLEIVLSNMLMAMCISATGRMIYRTVRVYSRYIPSFDSFTFC